MTVWWRAWRAYTKVLAGRKKFLFEKGCIYLPLPSTFSNQEKRWRSNFCRGRFSVPKVRSYCSPNKIVNDLCAGQAAQDKEETARQAFACRGFLTQYCVVWTNRNVQVFIGRAVYPTRNGTYPLSSRAQRGDLPQMPFAAFRRGGHARPRVPSDAEISRLLCRFE